MVFDALPRGDAIDAADHARLRHAREQHTGFPVGRYLQPPPMLFTRDGHNVFLGDMYRGCSAFLLGAGPSLATHDLSALERRGILTLAMNNAAVVHRPRLWCSVDDPAHFCDAIWYDPGVLKFVPLCHMEKRFAVRDEADALVESPRVVGDMPAVFGFRRNECFVAERFLYEDTFNWGNHGNLIDAHGVKGARSVMYVALRLLFYLGVRKVFLLGCDFRMEHGKANYAFEQDRTRASVNGNNKTYEALNVRLNALKPHFGEAGFEVVNCTPDSGLTVFPYLPYEAALAEATALVPAKINTAGMYDRAAWRRGRVASRAGEAERVAAPGASSPSEPDGAVRPESPAAHEPSRSATADPSDSPAAFRRERRRAASSFASLGPDASEPRVLPDAVTLVVPLRRDDESRFRRSLPTWRAFQPTLTEGRALLIRRDGDESTALDDVVWGPRVETHDAREWADDPTAAWELAQLRAITDRVETPWAWLLDPTAVATSGDDRPVARLLSSDRPAAVAGSLWGYARPADAVERLDDWADGVAGLTERPRLDVPFDPAASKVVIETLASWSLLIDVAWLRRLLSLAGSPWPCGNLGLFLAYCAQRSGERWADLPLKASAWDHSHSWCEKKHARRCAEALKRVPAEAAP